MPRAARVCPTPGCTHLVRGRDRYCEECTRQRQQAHDAARPSSARRGYDARWRAIRDRYLAEHPMCALCGRPASEVHHKLPLRAGGSHEWSNLQALCKPCHSSQTAKEDGGFGNPARGVRE